MTSLRSRCCHAPCSRYNQAARQPTCPPSPTHPTSHPVSSRDTQAWSISSRDSFLQTRGRIYRGGAFSKETTSATRRPSAPTASPFRGAWCWDTQTLHSIRLKSQHSSTPNPPWPPPGAAGDAGVLTASRPAPVTSPGKRNSTSVTSPDAGKYMAKPPT